MNLDVDDIIDSQFIVGLFEERSAKNDNVQNFCSCIPRNTKHLYVCKITSNQYCLFRESNNCRDNRSHCISV